MDKLNIKKRRVMMYFIEATQELILNEGIENLSIKKIADTAGYNTATIYNYFEDLEELILYSSIDYLKIYLKDLKSEINSNMKAIEMYEIIYKVFVHHSFEKPEIFHTLFFGKYSYKLEKIIKKYYEIFPDDITGQTDITKSVLVEGNIHNRDLPVIKQMIKEGSILEEEAPYIMEAIVRIHQSYLENILQQREKISLEEHKIKFFKIFNFLLKRNKK
ncbi:TetR/AcrR family transcriptional regulator [Fusobacterium animalis]|uniref:TetR/AcrR family transcriptional regulator n=1 Tax=Fusobacterium animalis TaxID=76859 RepID=UPI001C6F2AD6|nr:TetR/AcrR family transcriptional regulator [Fusobacterium animalis]QYR65973.1 TetR/AcrR family transcriptional regulator [Fusobacterium animalis]